MNSGSMVSRALLSTLLFRKNRFLLTFGVPSVLVNLLCATMKVKVFCFEQDWIKFEFISYTHINHLEIALNETFIAVTR